MTDKLRDAYRQLADAVPPMGNLDEAVRTSRRRRRRRTAGSATVALAAVATVAAIAVYPPWSRNTNSPATPPTNAATTGVATSPTPPLKPTTVVPPSGNLGSWNPDRPVWGSPAKFGTVLYRACESTSCAVKLISPDKRTVDLAKVRPEIAAKIGASGLEGASLSWDANWLGLRIGRGYEFHNLRTGQVEILPAGPAGSYWQALGWATGSWNVTAAQYLANKVLRYALFDTARGKMYTYDLAEGFDALPVEHGGDGVLTARPIDISVPPSQRPRVTTGAVDYLVLKSDDAGARQGTTYKIGWPPADFSAKLQKTETLAGPRGVLEQTCGPDPASPSTDRSCILQVFRPDQESVRISSALTSGRAGLRRIDLGAILPETGWRPLGNFGRGLGVALSTGHTTQLLEVTTAGMKVVHEFPADSQILIPGATRT